MITTVVVIGLGIILVLSVVMDQLRRRTNHTILDVLGDQHEPRWVSGPGGGFEEVICDICGVEMTEHPGAKPREEEEEGGLL